MHPIQKVHFLSQKLLDENETFLAGSELWHKKHQKTLFRVTYFLQIRVSLILQTSQIQSRTLNMVCLLLSI